MYNQILELTGDVGALDKVIETQTNSIGALTTQLEAIDRKVDSIDKRLIKAENQISYLGGEDPTLIGLSASDACQKSIKRCVGELDSYVLTDASVQRSSIVGNNSKGDELTVEDVAYKKLLIPYKDDGKECFFYGQLDQDGKWDGDCIVNIYENQKLVLITEAIYDSGKLSTFQQAFPNESKRQDGQDVWYFSKRTKKENFNIGETWDYVRNGDFEQTFSYDSVTVEDILTINGLKNRAAGQLEGYYNGNTSNGLYNDDSGEAYMVKYFTANRYGFYGAGTIRTLYVGKFKDGFPEDTSNDSWLIGRYTPQGDYSHYKGPFKGGVPAISSEAANAKDYWSPLPSQEDIDELLEGRTFNCDLIWSEQEFDKI